MGCQFRPGVDLGVGDPMGTGSSKPASASQAADWGNENVVPNCRKVSNAHEPKLCTGRGAACQVAESPRISWARWHGILIVNVFPGCSWMSPPPRQYGRPGGAATAGTASEPTRSLVCSLTCMPRRPQTQPAHYCARTALEPLRLHATLEQPACQSRYLMNRRR